MFEKVKKVHMIGIGGCGMSAIAEILHRMGYEVSGSDMVENDYTRRLLKLGIMIYKGHSYLNIKDPDLIIISSAIKRDNIELLEARKKGIPVILRGEALGWLMSLKEGIAVAGTHGKTTTTSLLAKALICGGFDPTIVVGGKLKWLGSNAFYGKGRYLVAEADESDGTFLCMNPKVAVITSVDKDHLDFYKDLSDIKDSFKRFIERVSDDGISVVCGDDKNIKDIIRGYERKILTYGLDEGNQISARLINLNYKTSFEVFVGRKSWARVVLAMPGIHNVLNALAVIGVGIYIGIEKKKLLEALSTFEGVGRRLELKGKTRNNVLVLDDYGHHPREIELTLNTVKTTFNPKRLIVVFQPHRYSRTKALYKEFCKCFKEADVLIVTSIYSAGEVAISEIKEDKLCREIENLCSYTKVHFCPRLEDCVEKLKEITCSGDVVLTVGAGDVWKVGDQFLKESRDFDEIDSLS